ncbi:zinc finger CCCH domain-containing protein 15 homolog [Arctopsyche grandis]|uniref:zinc finger CCCH domain-containing protein 15 homolog n=1 Tax=Arctopsyche grandis TaxID=121162 RepID=UPI00406D83CC
MPPKKTSAPSKKTEQKKKEKVIEDKTFGLKNKKGAKQQKFIQQVEKQVKSGGMHPLTTADLAAKKAEKDRKLKEERELGLTPKAVATQKVDKGTDPKSVVCAFFKQGLCTKGDKCKFSHDLTIERKAEKRSLYVDMRDDELDTMDNWNEEKLQEVVEKKHAMAKNVPTTDIICKHFLEAVEKSKYGWFWECPAGTKCIYRHALPPGFVLKRDKKKLDEKKNEISLVDLIERERAALGPKQTKITLETFIAWKKRKLQEKKDQMTKDEDQKRSEYRAGRNIGLSGREMFSFNPNLAADDEDDEEGGQTLDSRNLARDDEEDGQYKELQLDLITLEATEVDGTGTVAIDNRLQETNRINKDAMTNGSTHSSSETSESPTGDTGPINENLFLDDDFDEELQNLDLDK